MKATISLLTNVYNYNGSMKLEIFDNTKLLYSNDKFEPGAGRIDFQVNWPTTVNIVASNKNDDDMLVDEQQQIVENKAVEVTGILINQFAIQINLIDKLFHCQHQGQSEITHENFWGFNGTIQMHLTHSSPMRYLLSLQNQFDGNRLTWNNNV
jgi:hypothetical protein